MAEAEHGAIDAIKLASNELPFAPLPSVAGAISAGVEDVQLYPDHRAADLREALAEHHGLDVSQVTTGAGSAGILHQLTLAYVDPGERVAMCWPSFEVYPVYAAVVGASAIQVPLVDETFDLGGLAAAIDDDTKLAFIANPNNPTGTVVGTDEIVIFLEEVPSSCLVVLDEAYIEFVTDARVCDSLSLIDRFDHLVITRTFSKAHGLASLRCGYALSNPTVVSTIDKTLVPFAVNGLAQRAAIASLAAADEMLQRVDLVVAERTRVTAALRDADWSVAEPQANFVWLPVGSPSVDLGVELERRGVVTRVFEDIGIRITLGLAADNDRMMQALGDSATALGLER